MPELDLQVEIDRLAIENFVRSYSADMFQVVLLEKDNQSVVSSENNDSKGEEICEKISSPKQSRDQLPLKSNSIVSNKSSISSKSLIKKKIK